MRRGGSSGGGQSSLGYLFGSGEVPVPNNAKGAQTQRQPANNAKGAQTQCQPANNAKGAQTQCQPTNGGASQSANVATSPKEKGIAAGIHGTLTNNYHRADGQNCGNFITDRPSTKVHAAPGGGSSLGYLFGDPPSRN